MGFPDESTTSIPWRSLMSRARYSSKMPFFSRSQRCRRPCPPAAEHRFAAAGAAQCWPVRAYSWQPPPWQEEQNSERGPQERCSLPVRMHGPIPTLLHSQRCPRTIPCVWHSGPCALGQEFQRNERPPCNAARSKAEYRASSRVPGLVWRAAVAYRETIAPRFVPGPAPDWTAKGPRWPQGGGGENVSWRMLPQRMRAGQNGAGDPSGLCSNAMD